MNPMDMIHENNENMQGPLADQWRALMELRAGVDMERQSLALKMKAFEAAEHSMSFAAATNPLSPKNHQQQQQQQLISDRTTLSGSKRPSFSFGAQQQQQQHQDDDDFLLHKRAAKRAKQSHDALLLAQMRTNPLLGAHIQSQLPLTAAAASPLFLNPALQLAASTGYASAAVTQQLMLSQALANTSGINPLVQQQINSLINAEINRLAAATTSTEAEATGAPAVATNLPRPPQPMASVAASTVPKSDPVGVPPSSFHNSTSNEEECNSVACLNLGQEFLPATTQPTTLCDCGMSLCREIGYPHRGSIPFSVKTVDKWCKALDITDPIRVRTIKENPDCFRLAYWHFREEHWDVDELTGKLTIKSDAAAGKEEGVLPDAHLQSFIDEHKRAFPNNNNNNNNNNKKGGRRQPSQRMLALHNQWVQCRRAPTLEP